MPSPTEPEADEFEVDDAPSPEECKRIFLERRRLREAGRLAILPDLEAEEPPPLMRQLAHGAADIAALVFLPEGADDRYRAEGRLAMRVKLIRKSIVSKVARRKSKRRRPA